MRAAIDVFAGRGYGGASLREIGTRAGVEKGHITYYFPAKGDLLFEIVGEVHERFADAIAIWPGPTTDPPETRLRRLLRAHAALVCELHLQARVAYENLFFLTPERLQVIVGRRDHYEHELARLVDACRTEGWVADVPTTVLTKVLLGIVNWPYQWYSESGEQSPDEIATVLADRACAALRAPLH